MKTSTQYDAHARVYSNPGIREKILYGPKFDDHGHMELVETGRENLYDYIQSHKDSVDIKLILDRFARGDTAALSQRQGFYGDFTQMPTTYAEALNAMISAENYFNSLPVETRAQFNHSFQQFLAQMDKPDFTIKMGFQPAQVPSSPQPGTSPSTTVTQPSEGTQVPPGAPSPSAE